MAPSSSIPGNDAQSTPLASSSIVTPSVVIVSSAAGILTTAFFVILVVIIYRRIRFRRRRKAKHEAVPRLVITDTSMFPASSVVVDGEADLDKVIASFKPLGTESHIVEEDVIMPIVPRAYIPDEDDEQLFPALRISRPRKWNIVSVPERACSPRGDCRKVEADIDVVRQRAFRIPASLSSGLDPVETSEGVWWYDFSREGSLNSSSTLSDAGRSVSSESLYSTKSNCDIPATMKVSALSSGAPVSVLGEALRAGFDNKEPIPKAVNNGDDNEVGDKNQDTLYDKDILAYCWELSNDDSAQARKRRSRSSLHDNTIIDDVKVATMASSQCKTQSIPTHGSHRDFDQSILELCWKLSDNGSLKTTGHVPSPPPKVRFTAAARTVSDASVCGIGGSQSYNSGHVVYTL